MKIAIHCNEFDGRGQGKVPYDYGVAIRNFLNHEVVFITANTHNNQGLDIIRKEFECFLYEKETEASSTKYNIEHIISSKKIDFLHMIKSGDNDFLTPQNCYTGIHCVFTMTQPHGNVYAGVSEWLARVYGKLEYVPHIIQNYTPTENIRKKLNITENALIVGRHGGLNTFNIPFVKQAISDILKYRNDIFFIFLSTEKFIDHERVFFIPWVKTEQEKFNFIHSCDIMLHGRMDGETFGLSVAEFSVANKPVLTWNGKQNGCNVHGYSQCHLEILNNKAITYENYQTLMDILLNIDKTFINTYNWDKYSIEFSPQNVINIYNNIFLSNV